MKIGGATGNPYIIGTDLVVGFITDVMGEENQRRVLEEVEATFFEVSKKGTREFLAKTVQNAMDENELLRIQEHGFQSLEEARDKLGITYEIKRTLDDPNLSEQERKVMESKFNESVLEEIVDVKETGK